MAKITQQAIGPEELKILARVSKDPFYFSTFAWVVNPVLGRVKFDLYEFQKAVLYQFIKERFNIILKCRQMGITELIALYCLWVAMFHNNKTINIISIKDTVAKKVLRRIKFMYKNLPWYLQTPIINGRPGEFGSAQEMQFSNGSTIASIPTSEQAGRSESLSLLVIDEAAAVRWANQIWAAALPTLSTGGAAIINSCITGDTEIIGRNGNFRVEQVCPKDFGVQDIRFMNLEVLTHNNRWKRAIYGVNKGLLETWELKDSKNNILKCTPAHKLLTPFGWYPVEKIVTKGWPVIMNDMELSKVQEPPVTIPPEEEVWKPIKDFPGYLLSNLGRVKSLTTGKCKRTIITNGHHRVKLWKNGSSCNLTLGRLMVETFTTRPIPEGYVVDHIDCNPDHNYITNLQVITSAENTKRATLYSRGLILNTRTGDSSTNLELVGYIRYLSEYCGFDISKIVKRVNRYPNRFGRSVDRNYINRVINYDRCKNVYLSTLSIVKKYSDYIYDITVEDDHSYTTVNGYVSHNTPLGVGGWYHKSWVDALQGVNGINPIRLLWNMHPDRDQDWYNEMAKALGPKRTAQEIDGDFLSSGNTVFDMADIKAIEECLVDYPILKKRLNGTYREWNTPDPHKDYFIGADVATGRGTDYSGMSCMDRDGEEVAGFKGKIPVNKYARLLGDVGERFNFAKIAPESNDIGLAVTQALQDEDYPNLYYSTKILREKHKSKPKTEQIPGWYTTTRNRPIIIEGLEKDIREDNLIIKDPFFTQEAYTFIYDYQGRPVALGKHNRNSSLDTDDDSEAYSDDLIFGTAIANHIRKNPFNTVSVLPQ